MTNEKAKEIMNGQIAVCMKMLGLKNKEYAIGDALHNFKVASELQDCSIKTALAGMMAKHTVSVYDMCNSCSDYSTEQWSEKLTDHINYLLLLRCVIEEEKLNGSTSNNK